MGTLREDESTAVFEYFSVVKMTDENEQELRDLAAALLPDLEIDIGEFVGSPELILKDPRCLIITPIPWVGEFPVIAHIVPDETDSGSRIVLIDSVNPLQIKLEGKMDTPERRAALVALGFSELPGSSV